MRVLYLENSNKAISWERIPVSNWFSASFPDGSDGKEPNCNVDVGSISGSGRSLEKGMAPHSSILAWRIPWTKEPGGLKYMGPQKVRKSQVTNTFTFYSP